MAFSPVARAMAFKIRLIAHPIRAMPACFECCRASLIAYQELGFIFMIFLPIKYETPLVSTRCS